MSEITLETLHEILVRVEKKVEKTNGRVTRLEAWRNMMVGGLIVFDIFLVPIILKFYIN